MLQKYELSQKSNKLNKNK